MSSALEISEADIEKIAARGARSPVEFARIFFPEWFPQPMPWFHRGVLALLKGRGNFLLDFGHEVWAEGECDWTPEELQKILDQFVDEHSGEPMFKLVEKDGVLDVEVRTVRNVVIMLPRGFSKTTIINLNTCHEIAYRDVEFGLYVSQTAPHAQEQLETVKAEFESNELLRLVFGNKQPTRSDSAKWAADFIETTDGIMVGAVGSGGQIRGKNKHGKRPGLIIFDDLQDETSVESETERKKARRWFWRAAMKAGARNSRKIVLGTLLHKEAVLNTAMQNRQFCAIRFGAIDKNGDPLWAWHMNLDAIEEDRLAAIEAGELEGWYMEMMSEFRSDEARIFPESKLIYLNKGLERFTAVALALDPAISEKRKAAEAAFGVVGIEPAGFKHVLECEGKKGMDPYDQIEKFFELHFKYLAGLPLEQQRHGIEAVQFQAALLPMMRTTMVAKSRLHGQRAYFEVEPIYHGQTHKHTRIKGILKPLVWSGTLSFAEHLRTTSLHTQLIDFPGDLLDRPDVVAMATALLDPYVMLGVEEEGSTVDLANDNAPPLESVLGGDFRMAP